MEDDRGESVEDWKFVQLNSNLALQFPNSVRISAVNRVNGIQKHKVQVQLMRKYPRRLALLTNIDRVSPICDWKSIN